MFAVGRNSGIYSQGGGFNPATYFDIWFDADNAVLSGSNIEGLTNLGSLGASKDAAKTSDPTRPTLNNSNANLGGQKSIDTVAASQTQLDISSTSVDFTLDFETWLVGYKSATSTNLISFGSSSTTDYLFWNFTDGVTYSGGGGTVRSFATGHTTTADIYMLRRNATNLSLYRGSDGASFTASNFASTATINKLFKVNAFCNASIAQLSYKLGLNSTLDRNIIGNYLADKYNLTWTDL